MTKLFRSALIAGAALLALSTPLVASAQATPAIDQRQANQSQRIAEGQASGELTKREAARLKAGQARIANKEARANADGTVTAKERAAIKRAQNKQSHQIARQKHDAKSQ